MIKVKLNLYVYVCWYAYLGEYCTLQSAPSVLVPTIFRAIILKKIAFRNFSLSNLEIVWQVRTYE